MLHVPLERVSPLAVPVLIMIGRENVAQHDVDDALLIEAEQGAAEHVARVARRPGGVEDRDDSFDGSRGERIDGITAFLEMKSVWHPIGT